MVKLLKSPHSTHIVRHVLIVVVLVAIGEVLEPRVDCRVLGGTPIVVTGKAAKSKYLHRVKFSQLILARQIPIGIATAGVGSCQASSLGGASAILGDDLVGVC